MYIDLLEQNKGALTIVLYLLRNRRATFTELANENVISRQTCYDTIKNLEYMGIISAAKEIGWPSMIFYKLTRRGSGIAKSLLRVETVLEDTIDGYKRQLLRLNQESRLGKNMEKERLHILKKLVGECFNRGKWDEALKYGKNIIKLCRKTHNHECLAEELRNIGRVHQRRQKFEEARKYFQRSLNSAQKVNGYKIMASNNYDIGAIFEKKGNYSRALALYKKCEEYAKKCRCETEKARAYLGRGRILAQKGRYKESIKSMKKAVDIFKKTGTTEELPKAYTNLGSTAFYISMDEAIKWHKKCIEISESLGDIRMLGYGLSNAAGCYIKKREITKAKGCLERALPIFKQLGERLMVSSILTHYGHIYRLKMQWELAIQHLYRALIIAKEIRVPSQVADVCFQYGLMYKDKGSDSRSKHYLGKALKIYRNLGESKMIKKVKKELK